MTRFQLFSYLAAFAACIATTNGCSAQVPGGSGTKTAPVVAQLPPGSHEGLGDPSKAKFEAPPKFQAKLETTKGDIIIEVNRDWAPNGADRFYSMVKIGFFKDIAIFRAIDQFMFQFGIHGNPTVANVWGDANIKDDPSAGKSNVPGTISFAQTGMPNSRSTQMFINLGNNSMLDQSRGGGAPFVPFGQVVKGMDIVRKINTEYGENPRNENIQGLFKSKGNAYIKERFPNIDFIKSVTLVPGAASGAPMVNQGSGSSSK
jgi:peptidyl-prolyl cis-trans isomerase A (cyclophilin A)